VKTLKMSSMINCKYVANICRKLRVSMHKNCKMNSKYLHLLVFHLNHQFYFKQSVLPIIYYQMIKSGNVAHMGSGEKPGHLED